MPCMIQFICSAVSSCPSRLAAIISTARIGGTSSYLAARAASQQVAACDLRAVSEVSAGETLAKAAQDLVRDRVVPNRPVVGANCQAVTRPKQHGFVALGKAGGVANIDNGLVHTDPPDHRAQSTPGDHGASVRERALETIGV